VTNLAAYKQYIQDLKSETDDRKRAKMEDALLMKLQVYDFDSDEVDIFDDESELSA
jgi:hypothetical protein